MPNNTGWSRIQLVGTGYGRILFTHVCTHTHLFQVYSAIKSRHFKDSDTLKKIMTTQNPHEHRALAKRVSGFKRELWGDVREAAMMEALEAKFRQNSRMRKRLIETGDDEIVECCKWDMRWSNGLLLGDPDAANPSKWRGLNRLGVLLGALRNKLRREARLAARF